MSKEFREAEVYLKTLPKEMSREEIAEAARKLHDILFKTAYSILAILADSKQGEVDKFKDYYPVHKKDAHNYKFYCQTCGEWKPLDTKTSQGCCRKCSGQVNA